jgi:hypothetical protein
MSENNLMLEFYEHFEFIISSGVRLNIKQIVFVVTIR